jgi:hypothetical protein
MWDSGYDDDDDDEEEEEDDKEEEDATGQTQRMRSTDGYGYVCI